MADFLRQFAFLFLDIIIGVLKSVSSDMKHSLNARIKEQIASREKDETCTDIAVSDINCKQYKILYLNKDILILKKQTDIIDCTPSKETEPVTTTIPKE